MPARYFHRRSVHTLGALLVVFALLYTQGLRVCIHGAGFVGAAGDVTAPSICLESTLAANDNDACAAQRHGSDESDACWVDVSLGGILKDISIAPLLLPYLATLVALLPPRLLLRVARPAQPLFAASGGHNLRPPLRAPPRQDTRSSVATSRARLKARR